MVFTEAQKEVARQDAITTERVFAELRRNRKKDYMTGRIRAAWAQLDDAVEEIVRLNGTLAQMQAANDLEPMRGFEADLELEKARVRGKAEILALIMPAPLNTPDAISAEAGRRYQAKQKGEKYETPGLRIVAATIMDDVVGDPRFT